VSGGGFSVVMSDLQSTASAFASESKKLAGLIPAGGPPVPDGGNGAIDSAMHSAVSSIGELNQALAQAMAAHAQKLSKAHDNYANNEVTLSQLSQDLSNELAPVPPTGHPVGK
jgi:4-aminobutyrate aminotransferase-like enzyme